MLQRRPGWSGGELAERLGVDARTVRRDVDRLRGLGYEIVASPGTGGGYRLGGSSSLPPLLLDEDEATAVAVVLGISAGAAIPGIGAELPGEPGKLDRLLPPRLRAQLAALRASTVALVPPLDIVPAEVLVELALACDSHLRATFSYQARDGAEATRRVEPHRLVATDRRWYLIAYDLDRDDWRTFRADRIAALQVSGHRFEPRPLENPARLVAEAITAAGYRHRAVVRLDAPAEEVSRLVGPSIGVVEHGAEGALLTIGVDNFYWLAGYLIGLGLTFEVLEPPEMRSYLVELGTQLCGRHGPAPAPPGGQ
ncbi:MAG TPA: WYL domain-containing protein [Acidimicrobiales bacterium]|nr:WYL domain-containing protein [Acidimicrobiales bacterium]